MLKGLPLSYVKYVIALSLKALFIAPSAVWFAESVWANSNLLVALLSALLFALLVAFLSTILVALLAVFHNGCAVAREMSGAWKLCGGRLRAGDFAALIIRRLTAMMCFSDPLRDRRIWKGGFFPI